MKKMIVILCILSLTISCKKDNGSVKQDKYPFYFTATINGAFIKYEANDIDSKFECGISRPSSSPGSFDHDIYEGTLIQDGTNPSNNNIYVHILKYFNYYPLYDERFSMFKLGSYPYEFSNVSNATINGVSISYIDANGKNWHSENGSQAGSTFIITELGDNPDGTSGKIFKASFNCKLYDANGGSIQVTNAVIRGKVFNP